MSSRIVAPTAMPDDIYYLIFQLKRSSLPQENTKFPFHDMLRCLEDIKTHHEKMPESTDKWVYIRVSTPFLTWYEAKTRELLMKYTLNALKHTDSWKIQDNESVYVKSDSLEKTFQFSDAHLKRLKGSHKEKIRIGSSLLRTAHAFFQDQRLRNYTAQYEESTMPLLEFDIKTVGLTFDEKNIQSMYKAENMVFEEKKEEKK